MLRNRTSICDFHPRRSAKKQLLNGNILLSALKVTNNICISVVSLAFSHPDVIVVGDSMSDGQINRAIEDLPTADEIITDLELQSHSVLFYDIKTNKKKCEKNSHQTQEVKA